MGGARLAATLGAATAALAALAWRFSKRRAAAAAQPSEHVEPLSPTDEAAVAASVAFAATSGLLMRARPDTPHWVHCPFSLRPTPFPRAEFERALRLAPLYGRLVHAIARDVTWLHETLRAAAAGDEFTSRLLEISRAVAAEGDAQPIRLGLHRADYMLHVPGLQQRGIGRAGGEGGKAGCAAKGRGSGDGRSGAKPPHTLLQVELNTIASSFGALSAVVARMHAAVAPPPTGDPHAAIAGTQPPPSTGSGAREATRDAVRDGDGGGGGDGRGTGSDKAKKGAGKGRSLLAPPRPAQPTVAQNPALHALPDALAAAHRLYKEFASASAAAPPPAASDDGGGAGAAGVGRSQRSPLVVLFVAQPSELNSADQHLLAAALGERTGGAVRSVRRTLQQLADTVRLGPSSYGGGGSARSRALLLSPVPELYDCGHGGGGSAGGGGSGGSGGGGKNGVLEAEVAVCYFRAGYSPSDYPTESCWAVRLLLERSLAVKCPSVDYQLVGTKKVQQALAMAGVVERFLPNQEEAAAVRASFAGLWDLEALDRPFASPPARSSPSSDAPPSSSRAPAVPAAPAASPASAEDTAEPSFFAAAPAAAPATAPAAALEAAASPPAAAATAAPGVPGADAPQQPAQQQQGRQTLRQRVLECPEDFVLKPQREGGGHNYFGSAIPPKLASLRPGEEAAYTLMERICPPVHSSRILVRDEAAAVTDTLSELGVFTAFLAGTEGEEVRNEYAGWLLRTKPARADEGGVAAGFSVLDSPLLC